MEMVKHFYNTSTSLVPFLIMAIVLAAYLSAVARQYRSARRWNGWRTASFIVGISLLFVALLPSVINWGHHDLRGHMVQHLLIGMFAPLGLVLAAPVTLTLRTLPVQFSRFITALLRSQPFHWLSHPATALILNIGGMYLLYLTPLYALTLSTPVIHHLVHLHFLLAGYLFSWAIAGPDPAPRRPGLRTRLVTLFIAIAAHAYLSKLMYANAWPHSTPHNIDQIKAAAQLMYYGGDLAELLLTTALFATWYRNRRLRPNGSKDNLIRTGI